MYLKANSRHSWLVEWGEIGGEESKKLSRTIRTNNMQMATKAETNRVFLVSIRLIYERRIQTVNGLNARTPIRARLRASVRTDGAECVEREIAEPWIQVRLPICEMVRSNPLAWCETFRELRSSDTVINSCHIGTITAIIAVILPN
jgi:hypothetical protein